MLKPTIINLFQITLSALVILGSFGLAGTTPTALAQSADFQWGLTGGDDLTIEAEAFDSSSEYTHQWQVVDESDEVVLDQTTDTPEVLLFTGSLTPGQEYNLQLTVRDSFSNSVLDTHIEVVALPALTIEGRCITTFQGRNVEITVDIVPVNNFFPNLGDPEVTLIENGNPKNPVFELPHVYEVGQPNRTYQAEVAFSDSNIQLTSNTITLTCEDESDEEEEARFSYAVSGNSVTAEALSPLNDNYHYSWDVGGEAGVDYRGRSLSHTFPADGDASVRLVISQDDTIIGEKVQNFVVPANFQDSDGDGTPDTEEADEDDDSSEDDSEEDGEAEFTGDEEGLVNCTNNCGWEEFIALINRLITWLIGFATVVATLLFMYAGFLYLTAGGDETQATQAKGIFINVGIGFGIILVAWLVVSAIVTLLTTDEWRDNNQQLIPIELSYESNDGRLQL